MRTTTYNHKYLSPLLKKEMVGIDLTLGGGNDTVFLAEKIRRVYAFDIQPAAILETKTRAGDLQNIIYINASHALLKEYVKERVDIVMFNSGYYPHGDHNLTTDPASSLTALQAAYDLLKDGGYLSVVLYRGHKGGLTEANLLTEWILSDHFIIDKYFSYTCITEPISYIIRK